MCMTRRIWFCFNFRGSFSTTVLSLRSYIKLYCALRSDGNLLTPLALGGEETWEKKANLVSQEQFNN